MKASPRAMPPLSLGERGCAAPFPTQYGKRKELARELRREETDAERLLWGQLRNRKLDGFKFRRQFPIGPCFADFCCFEFKLVVELDGGHHSEIVRQDKDRSEGMKEKGFQVIRFWNTEIETDIDCVCERIRQKLQSLKFEIPLPEGEGRAKLQGEA
jgi:very-short-patch-repair endonuclease